MTDQVNSLQSTQEVGFALAHCTAAWRFAICAFILAAMCHVPTLGAAGVRASLGDGFRIAGLQFGFVGEGVVVETERHGCVLFSEDRRIDRERAFHANADSSGDQILDSRFRQVQAEESGGPWKIANFKGVQRKVRHLPAWRMARRIEKVVSYRPATYDCRRPPAISDVKRDVEGLACRERIRETGRYDLNVWARGEFKTSLCVLKRCGCGIRRTLRSSSAVLPGLGLRDSLVYQRLCLRNPDLHLVQLPPHDVPLLSRVVGIQHQNDKGNDLKPSPRICQEFSELVGVNAVFKAAKETTLMICGMCCLVAGWFLIRGVLPDQRHALGALSVGLLGLLLLFCAQRLIWKSLDLFYEAIPHSDFRVQPAVSSDPLRMAILSKVKRPSQEGWAFDSMVVDVQETVAIRSRRLQKLPHRPRVVCDSGLHGGRDAQCAVDTNEVIPAEVNAQRRPVVVPFLAEGVRQPGESPHVYPHREILAPDVRRAYLVWIGIAHDWDFLRAGHIGRAIPAPLFLGCLRIDVDELGEVAAVAQCRSDRGDVRLESIGADFKALRPGGLAQPLNEHVGGRLAPASKGETQIQTRVRMLAREPVTPGCVGTAGDGFPFRRSRPASLPGVPVVRTQPHEVRSR